MLKFRTAFGLGCALLALPASAQYGAAEPPGPVRAPTAREGPADALARHVRVLAQSPRNFAALVGAGRAALAVGDADAAVAFFGRASDVWPSAPAPRAGMGAALAALGDAPRALLLFDQAQRAGAAVTSFAVDRGLARDLLGQQALAQTDYRLALAGPDAAEARRRLALSQAISGDRTGALATLSALRADPATNRTRAFVLALGGDVDSASRSLDISMPGMARRLDPFFRRLASLSPAQKAAAVHLGIIPGSDASPGGDQFAARALPLPSPPPSSRSPVVSVYAAPRAVAPAASNPYGPPSPTVAGGGGDRLSGIDELLRAGQSAAPLAAPRQSPQTAAQSLPPPPVPAAAPRRVWVQLASGTDEAAFGAQFGRIAARDPQLFKGISPYVAEVGGRAKLLVGPFRNSDDGNIFVENLNDARIDGFSWTSPEGQAVRKLTSP